MLAQMTLSAQIEREMGSGGFLITYFAAGIFGYVTLFYTKLLLSSDSACRNVLGANFALVGAPSLGASGAIFGTLAVREPVKMLGFFPDLCLPGNMGRSLCTLEVSI